MSDHATESKNMMVKEVEVLEMPMNVPFHMMTYQHPNLIQFEHSHAFFELGYVREGSIVHFFTDKSVYAKKGDYFIIDIGDIHSYKSLESDGLLVMQNCLFLPSVIDNSMRNCETFREMISSHPLNIAWELLEQNPTSTIFHDETGEIGMMLDILSRETNGKDCHPQVLKGLLSTILVTTMQKIMKVNSNSSSDIINTILKYASEHYFEDNILTSLSQEIHYSMPYLSGVFKKKTGRSFKEHIQKLRIEEACRLLISSNYKISYISSLAGYRSETHFRKIFMEFTGTTPKKYRMRKRNEGLFEKLN